MKYLVILIILFSCTFNPSPVTPEPVTDDVVKLCNLACSNMVKMRCAGWDGSSGIDEEFGTTDDLSCSEVCIEIENSGTGISLHPGCVAVADSCEAVDKCFVE